MASVRGGTAEGGCPHILNLDGRMRPSLYELFAAYCQAIDPDCGGGYCAAEFEVVGNIGDVEEEIFQIARNGNFFDRIGEFAAGNPETGCAAGVVARDQIHSLAEEFGYVQAILNSGDQVFRALGTGL